MPDRQTLFAIEDDDIDYRILSRTLSRLGADVELVRAHDGEQALEMLRQGRVGEPTAVLLDLNMPRMNGFEFLQSLRDDPSLPSPPIHVMTTSGNPEDRARALSLGVASYIVKADEPADFVESVADLLDQVGVPRGA